MNIDWDSCVTIYRVENVAPWAATVVRWLDELDANARLQVSELTRMECRLAPLRAGNDELLQRYDDFFAQSDIATVDLSRAVFDRATELRARHRLKTPDAIHLAAAIEAHCDQFWTNDRRLSAAAAAHLEVRALAT